MSSEPAVSRIRKIALIGNFPPRLCGIATFTADVYHALREAFPAVSTDVYAMNDPSAAHDYGGEVVAAISQNELADYQAAALAINQSGADVVLVQHEYGIFGGAAGIHLLKLLDRVDAPVVLTLHTVLLDPNPDQRAVLDALARRASRLIVMAEKGREILERVHGLARERIAIVPHGVPNRALTDPDQNKARFGLAGRKVLLTFGLLSPNKGIETMIRAMPEIVTVHSDAVYVVLGATHPHLVAHEGEAYREKLQRLASELGVSDHVLFVDGFVEQDALLDRIEAADVYVTPYLNEEQITSGTLSYAVGLGRPVVSTPYWHAAELLAKDVGVLVPFGSSQAFADAIIGLLGDPQRRATMRRQCWKAARSMTWDRLAHAYMEIMEEAVERMPVRLKTIRAEGEAMTPSLEAVERLTDGVGILQHAIYSVPDRDHGYCVDDNCRALILMHRIGGEQADRADELAVTYASFVQHAWNGERGRFRNFMGYDRQWLESEGSQDSFGRSLWSIGVTAAEARQPDLRRWALHLFDQVAPHASFLDSLRSWAFALFGASALLDVHPGHSQALHLIEDFGARLHERFLQSRRAEWEWFEPVLAYDNARIPEALIRAGLRIGNSAMVSDGMASLAWLDTHQRNDMRQFRAVGTDSFGRAYAPPNPFDQQPLEAWATMDAARHAFRVSGDPRWHDMAQAAWRWYLGDNDLALPMCAPGGGCYDGLMSDRANLNQGAESVLAFQFACVAMRQIANMGASIGGEAAVS